MQLYHPRSKTAHRALQRLFLRLYPFNRPQYQPDTSGHNAICETLERIHAPGRPQPIPRYHRHAETLHRSAQAPIIIMYIRGQTMPAAAGQLLPCADHWQALTLCQQYRPGAPAEGSTSPPVQGHPGGISMLLTPGGWKSGAGSACPSSWRQDIVLLHKL